jgi:sulfonate transport system permease protein
MLAGWLLASLLGVALGALIGASAAVRQWLQPMLEFLRPLPASAVLPLAIALFGLSPGMVLFVVAFGAMWPVLLATLHGFAHLHRAAARGGRGAAAVAHAPSSSSWACPTRCPTCWPACGCR